MDKQTVVKHILENTTPKTVCDEAYAFAPTNMALCKYWGKRDTELNLPVTSSLSVTLGNKGAFTRVRHLSKAKQDRYVVNGHEIGMETPFAKNLHTFLNLFRPSANIYYQIETDLNIPVGAGLASSACGFAALVRALNNFYGWQLDKEKLSILARLGSGSACRSFWTGFVEWQAGNEPSGMDSYGRQLSDIWPDLCVGIVLISKEEKSVSSRVAMEHTKRTSPLYEIWPEHVVSDMENIKHAIAERDFEMFGRIAEGNAMLMHETMLNAEPPIQYSLPETYAVMEEVQRLRQAGAQIFFTQDAGPNLALLFLEKDLGLVEEFFPGVSVIKPFANLDKLEHVVLVDAEDQVIGSAEKIQVHQAGQLHRAFSVFVFRQNGGEFDVLLQQRSDEKYHSGGLWSNTCCGHPYPNEDVAHAAKRRLQEEMGLHLSLESVGSFNYRVTLENGLLEHELDHVFVGVLTDEEILPNPHEIQAIRWISLSDLQEELVLYPEKYTQWLPKALDLVIGKIL